RVEDFVVRGSGRHQELDLATTHVDVDRFVAFGVVVQRLVRIAGGLAHERFLHVASLHVNQVGRTIYAVTLRPAMRTLEYDEAQRALILIDQTRLPRETSFVACR